MLLPDTTGEKTLEQPGTIRHNDTRPTHSSFDSLQAWYGSVAPSGLDALLQGHTFGIDPPTVDSAQCTR
jgi:hypothetical protein